MLITISFLVSIALFFGSIIGMQTLDKKSPFANERAWWWISNIYFWMMSISWMLLVTFLITGFPLWGCAIVLVLFFVLLFLFTMLVILAAEKGRLL